MEILSLYSVVSMFPPHLLPVAEEFLPKDVLRALQSPTPEAVATGYSHLAAVLAGMLPFVPAPVLDVLANNPLNRRIIGSQLRGTLLFANLTGYTDVLTSYAQQGRQGNETAGAMLQAVFRALADVVVQYGGGVIKIHGDSLTAIFESARVNAQHATLAVAAALHMQEITAAHGVAHSQPRLQLQLALHTGTFFMAEVGDDKHRELLLTGASVHKLAQLHDSAPPGEVVVSPETLALIQAQTIVQPDGSHVVKKLINAPTLPAVQPNPESGPPTLDTLTQTLNTIVRLQPFLMRDLPLRFIQSDVGLGEFRPVTVAVSSFQAFRRLLNFLEMATIGELDQSIIGQLVDIHFTETQSVVHQYGGVVSAIEMAASGDRLIALFGAPTGHEDDPQRAVEAMLALRAKADVLQQRVLALLRTWTSAHPEHMALLPLARELPRRRVGIATGTVFAGLIGSEQYHSYNVIGETVSLAAHLMQAVGEGSILLAARTYELVQQPVVAEPQVPLLLKDHGLVPVYRAITLRAHDGELASAPLTASLIDREAAFTQLTERAHAALNNGQTQIVSITGELGIGKSRLLDEFWHYLSNSSINARLLREACQSYEQSTPYALISKLLSQLLPSSPRYASETHIEYLQQQLDVLVPEWSRFTPLLSPLVKLPFPETDLTQALSSEQRRDRLHDLLVALVLGFAEQQPFVLAIDDLHWIDPSSALVLEQLTLEMHSHSLLLLLSYRPTTELAQPWKNLANSTEIQLHTLDQNASIALLTALLGAPAPAAVLPLLQRTQGVPLFLEQMVRYLVDTKFIQQNEQGDWIVTKSISEAAVPLKIEQLIFARFDQLAEDTRTAAQTASVIGQQFDVHLLQILVGEGQLRQLHQLRRAGLVVQLEDTVYTFKPGLVCDVVRESIAFARRRELHSAVASAIEQVYAEDLSIYRVVLAQHYIQAEQPELAFPHLLVAAQEAQACYANQEAVTLYSQALYTAQWYVQDGVVPDLTFAVPLYEGLGDVLALTGSYSNARDCYGALVEMIDIQFPTTMYMLKAALQRKIGNTLENQGSFETALQRLRSAAETIQQAPPDVSAVEYARILSDIGWVYFRQSDLAQSQLYLEQALNQLEEEEFTSETARIYNRLGGIAWQRGDLATAQHYVEQSLRVSEAVGDLGGQANALNNLGNLFGGQGKLEESVNYSLQAMDINEYLKNRRELAFTANNAGWTLYDQGQHQKAAHYFGVTIKYAKEIHDVYTHMRALLNLARVMIALEQFEDAASFLEQSQLIAVQNQAPAELVEIHVVTAEVALVQGRIDSAFQAFEQALLLPIQEDSEEYGRLQRLEAKLAVARGERVRAVELLHTNIALFTRLQNKPEADRTRILIADIEGQA